ncbi:MULTISPECIES: hypothetical protein [Actinokineospora]|uniref:Uncharacterized protein n=1 Tax=Actinokineospora fastidiosa TaxID=1816 RepID=A0A918GDS0_9PSEU|nr:MULTISPECIES: hypothetical protein [Actinokineospora]UVS79912.1 hypothetical protein Actkin_03662 [Actinokineospora sp. UTMC 2448]GGS31714.1 hypothetical protein GCM10010171_27020 [Actinokineospora fastidiosa]
MTRQLDAPPALGSPSPGLDLRRAVEAALVALDSPSPSHDLVADDLLGALARTAAIGDTCVVLPAAEAVGLARRHLRAERTDAAHTALTQALALLSRRP